ncbi:putative myosin I [Acaromyces ingoldii]|uniref:Putative myosin I n=1 Tax=Acaromyces ingoldii TaxID=215250 RepID=A0A316YRK5_9BASI|nr:putative myosin I [Acaromyces ingoldii]PWN91742.1 putative myosin I [Acaromyces ingoldii]
MAISKKAGKKGGGAAPPGGGKSAPPKKGGVAKADWREGFKKPQAGVSDMTLLTTISNEAVNQNLEKRFRNGEIYTYIGSVLISVNPFRDLGIYTDEVLASYRGKNRLEMTPHVFAIAEGAYYNMIAYKDNQCVIISGESGAGKTEAAKRIMQYIAAVSGGDGSDISDIKEMVLATNPLLESFGCAKTLRNNNSSRHGKYLQIMFNAQGEPIGANITNYLLEKGRVVGQFKNERNFHIFYQLSKAATPEMREAFGLQEPSAYAYTANSKCLDVDGINDYDDFSETIKAMGIIGLSGEEQNEIFRMLAAILWLGNATFVENDQGNAQIADQGVLDFVAYLLEVDATAITKALTERIVETQRGGRRGSIYESPNNPIQAASVRDALSKAIYNNLFDWIVARVNKSMAPRQATSNIIGVLDIYGFEIFEDNSFEQLCINYVNESLQQLFIQLTLRAEQQEYADEQIKWTPIKYFDNQIVLDCIEAKRPPGIFAALNDACATAHADPSAADNAFSQRLGALSANPHFEPRGTKFLVRHYAGDVLYNVKGMTDKNKDSLLKDILNLVDSSQNQFLHTLFPDRPDPDSKKRPPTAGDRIKSSANLLIDTLMKSQPSYIRTIKPNQNKSPTEYDTAAILSQVKYLNLTENIRVRRAGFAYRNTFEKLVERFYLLSPATSYAGEYTWTGDVRSGCERILIDTGIPRDQWQMGVTKAFIKDPETLFALETMRDNYWQNMARRIQRAYRNWMRYKNEAARRIQRMWLNNKEKIAYSQLRDYGHDVLAQRKERRRFSLISMRKFMGDYLDVNSGSSAEGEMLKRASGMGSTETVAFSARAELLVSKLGRSSKAQPRFLVLTDKALYIIITQLVNKQPQTTCERKILLGTIQTVGLSNLRDDWIIINVMNSQEPDPVLHTHFKTEFVTHLLQRTSGGINVNINSQLEYSKGKDKKSHITFKKDETIQREDVYKSSTVSVASGESPSSVSRPPAKRKPGIVKPITQGKLLRPGGPSNPNRKPKAVALPRSTPKPAAPLPSGSRGPAKPSPIAVTSTPSATTNARVPPPPKRPGAGAPPPPPAAPQIPLYKALYDFETDNEGEMSLVAGESVEVTTKETNGWWLVKKNGAEGWSPSDYLELIPAKPAAPAAPAPAKRAPPPAPAKASAAPAAASALPSGFGAPKPKPAVATPPVRAHERPQSVAPDVGAAPVAVLPGMDPGGFAAVLAKKKAAMAAERGETNGDSAPNGSAVSSRGTPPPPPGGGKPKPSVAPKPGGANGRAMPPPPPRR